MKAIINVLAMCTATALAACSVSTEDSLASDLDDEELVPSEEQALSAMPTTLCGAVYEHAEHGGAYTLLRPGAVNDNVGRWWNDMISSIRVFRGCELRAYEHERYGGRSQLYRAGDGPATDFDHLYSWNDRITSYDCQCRGDVENNVCGYLYEHVDFQGAALPIAQEEYIPRLGELGWNDEVSSAELVGSCSLTIWEHADRGGGYQTFKERRRAARMEKNDAASTVETKYACVPKGCYNSRNCGGNPFDMRDRHNCRVRGGKSWCSDAGDVCINNP